jgi:toxin-antitoxin system PIN domain toxin
LIAVDTNLLVYAHRRDSEWHEPAARLVRQLAEGRTPWAVPWPCVHEFLGIVTHPRIYAPPSTMRAAIDQTKAWMGSPSLVLIGEDRDYLPHLEKVLLSGKIVGPRVHDARIAALCLEHGVQEIWTADRDFGRFSSLRARNPLVN